MSAITHFLSDRAAIRRLGFCALIAFCVVASLALQSATERATAQANDSAVKAAWQALPAAQSPSGPSTPEATLARLNIKQAAANAELTWQAASDTELRSGLRALDAAQIKLTQVKFTRSGAGYLVTAERAP